MDRLVIKGEKPLRGCAVVQGSKNAALPILAASILSSEKQVLSNVPELSDIETMIEIIRDLGGQIDRKEKTLWIDHRGLQKHVINEDAMMKMRSSLFLCGPLLARFGEVTASLPGGCAIGDRKIDLHLDGFRALGAKVEWEQNAFRIIAPKGGLTGASIVFHFPSVGATENVMLAAVLANGETVIENAACEPEIVDLANCLKQMGAKIEGEGTKRLFIRGVRELSGFQYRVMPDRIAAGTWMLAGVLTKGHLTIEDIRLKHLTSFVHVLKGVGVHFENETENSIDVIAPKKWRGYERIVTAPYPAFPTDLQAPMATFLAFADGQSHLRETIFERRFRHFQELNKMGACIDWSGKEAVLTGVRVIRGAKVVATDLRAGAALVLAGLAAEGETIIEQVHHIDRGYERIENYLNALGAEVARR